MITPKVIVYSDGKLTQYYGGPPRSDRVFFDQENDRSKAKVFHDKRELDMALHYYRWNSHFRRIVEEA